MLCFVLIKFKTFNLIFVFAKQLQCGFLFYDKKQDIVRLE